ncbi:NAD(P)H-binding protein [Propioniciclava flava]|uniref:Nucleoside-diphosphate sugar epimerase n=1 Tax=Propioniciclava flava TaxID=2072026 RepID=A0A4Q2ECH5_9ACTN|nr:NAD(P)H-binding protein [Propioniciclava flava]RXW31097.1 nucleoside-diphosphate sugar epimerase [Propioniciclava flava]
MTVLVVGASGAVGSAVVAGLLERGVEVRASSRTPERLGLPKQVRVFAADLNEPASFAAALDGVDRVFLYADLEDPEAVTAAFVAAGVRHVVVLSSSSVTFPGAAEDFNGSRFLRVEAAIEKAGLGYTFLRPGGFASNAARWSWGVKGESAVPLPYPEAVQAPIHERDIADVAVIALTSDALIGQAPVLTGPERLTLRQQVDTIGAVIGRPVAVIEQTEAESTAMLSQYVPDVWVHQIIKDWREAVGSTPALSNEYTRITGRPARTFRTWVEDNIDLFR